MIDFYLSSLTDSMSRLTVVACWRMLPVGLVAVPVTVMV